MRRMAMALAAVALGASPLAAQKTCPMTYPVFEEAVPHLDLDKCPADLAREGVFCRASVANDAVHVFAFELDGDQCLVKVKSYKAPDFRLTLR